MTGLNILLIGGGGREHALAWKIRQSPLCNKLYCAPGNAGIANCAEVAPIKDDDISSLASFAVSKHIDFAVIGPEGPLVLGIADALRGKGIRVFGPSQAAAQLEGSKGFMKDLCAKYDIPTARYGRFKSYDSAKAFIESGDFPVVLKADGLAAGKGVIIAQDRQEALDTAKAMLEEASFGEAGAEIVIEEYLDGEEVSYFAITDGKSVLPLTSAQDHKRAYDGDKGPNTGGMGAYSPARGGIFNAELEQEVLETIIQPTVEGMVVEGCPFSGVLYAGLMIVNGKPYLLEYNIRFGDPECQPLMMRLKGDLVEVLLACAEERLEDVRDKISWSDKAALCVVMAAKGYPGAYPKNTIIHGLRSLVTRSDTEVFHAGTGHADDGKYINIGGRVLGITATGDDIKTARDNAYDIVNAIDWPEGFCRRDIGWRAL